MKRTSLFPFSVCRTIALSLACFFPPALHFGQTPDYQQVTISTAPDSLEPNGYANSVDIQGELAMIGAFSENLDSQSNNNKEGAGAVYVWKRNVAGEWVFQQKFTPEIRNEVDFFGRDVSIHGEYALISAPGKIPIPNENNKGAAYIFKRDGEGNWQEMQMIYAAGATANDLIGERVALYGRFAILSAYGLATGNVAAYVFERDSLGETWTQVANLLEPEGPGNEVGWSVDTWEDYVVLGAPEESWDENGQN